MILLYTDFLVTATKLLNVVIQYNKLTDYFHQNIGKQSCSFSGSGMGMNRLEKTITEIV